MTAPFHLAAPALAATLALSLAACASGGGSGPQRDELSGAAYRQSVFLSGASLLFVQFDADGDYVTTRSEVEAGARTEWAKATAGAASLSPIGFEAWAAKALGGPNLGPYRLAFDTNVNNEITAAEFSAAILAKFDSWDKDKNGALARTEMSERLPEIRRPADGAAPLGGQQRPPGGRPPR